MSCFSICDSESRWRLIEDVKQRNEDGSFLKYENDEELTFDYYEDLQTHNLYRAKNSSPCELRAKALGLIMGSPFYAVGVMAVDLIAIILAVGRAVWRVFEQISQCNIGPELKKIAVELLDESCECAVHAFLTPLFWLMLEGAALVTLVSPLDGMKLLGDVQLAWFPGKSLANDPNLLAVRRKEEWASTSSRLPAMWHKPYEKGAIWFIAPCVLPRGNRSDKIELGYDIVVPRYEFTKKEGE